MEEDQVQFFYEEINYKLQSESKIGQWLKLCASKENKNISLINYIFCTDAYLIEINKQYLKHDYYTDIITFEYSENEASLTGDVFISVDRAKENSIKLNQNFESEIMRLLVHGLLHLMGYKDKEPQDKKMMTSKEDHYLSLLK